MIIRIKIALFIFIISGMFSCKNTVDNLDKDFHFHATYTLYTNNKSVKIINEGSEKTSIKFKINEKFWFSKEDIINTIKNQRNEILPGLNSHISNAWNFVIANSLHYNDYDLDKYFKYHPLIFINSPGMGLCSNRNAVLSNILREMGYKSRTVHLQGHVVSEVYFNKSWHMLDADYHVYFLKDNCIAAVSDLEENIKNAEIVIHNDLKNFMSVKLLKFPEHYFNYFTTKDNNRIINSYKTKISPKSVYLDLPPEASVKIPAKAPKNKNAYSFGKMIIPGSFHGNIHVPFMFFTDNESILMNGFISEKRQNYPPGRYFVSGKNLIFYVYLNPLFCELEEQTFINIRKSKNTKITVKACDYNYSKQYMSLKQSLINDLFDFYACDSTKNDFIHVDTIKIRGKEDMIYYVENIYMNKYMHKMGRNIREKLLFACKIVDSKNNSADIYKEFNQKNALMFFSVLIFNYNKNEIENFLEYNINTIN